MISGPNDGINITQELWQHLDLQTPRLRSSPRLPVASAILRGQLIDLNPPRNPVLLSSWCGIRPRKDIDLPAVYRMSRLSVQEAASSFGFVTLSQLLPLSQCGLRKSHMGTHHRTHISTVCSGVQGSDKWPSCRHLLKEAVSVWG